MAIVVEDGSIVTNANSYVTIAEARTYAAARGVTLSATDGVVEPMMHKAMDYLEAQGPNYQGQKTDPTTQELQWPRAGVYLDGLEQADDTIPTTLKRAQMRLVMEINAGTEILATSSGAFVTREKVGPIDTEYSEKIGTTSQPIMPAVDALLQPLMTGFPGRAISVRV